jgi:hypothetical protein
MHEAKKLVWLIMALSFALMLWGSSWLLMVLGLDIRDGKIVEIDAIADPARLRRLDLAVLDDRRPDTPADPQPTVLEAAESYGAWRLSRGGSSV